MLPISTDGIIPKFKSNLLSLVENSVNVLFSGKNLDVFKQRIEFFMMSRIAECDAMLKILFLRKCQRSTLMKYETYVCNTGPKHFT